ncbi:hypothetical protein B0H15DRAFT_984379 [Mycena belliarum]|uniref:Uncharacterized protein n=1 Tax=Mycena belliarum TaxID=1033014 RepID=A0AAD6XTH7_9AGAR|nr:hypothetical protein B0H15DRAFT_984379 [Mycena belliae]
MATQRSPHTPSSIPTRKGSTSLLPTRRPSFSTPGPSSPSGSGVSGFRALRSLLPFGPNKHSTPVGGSSPVPNGGPRFASFSAVRKSITRDRNASLSVTDLPVMVIDQASGDNSADFPQIPVRKSISLYDEKPLPSQPMSTPVTPTLNLPGTPEEDAAPSPATTAPEHEDRPPVFIPPIRTPSPLPELSTIIEADTSGISKHLPSESPSPSPSPVNLFHPSLRPETLPAEEVSALDLSTTHLTSQVMDAMRAQGNNAVKSWIAHGAEPSRAALADQADVSFNLGALDPDLAALLSPNRMVPSDTTTTLRAKSLSVDLSDSPLPSAPESPGLRPQHQSSRPRLRPIQRPSTSPSEGERRSASVSSSTGHSQTVRRGSPLSRPPSPVQPTAAVPPSPLSRSHSPVPASTPAPVRRIPQAVTSTPQVRRPMLGRMLQSDNTAASFNSRSPTSRPSLDSVGYRPSSASTSRASLDTNRHRPSLDGTRHTNTNTVRERPSETATAWNLKLRRSRKRSMSVDGEGPSGYASPHSESRPASSMSHRPEWLGPRTAKAFMAAGLLGSPDSADGSDSLSPPTAGRNRFFGSARSSATVGRSDSRIGVASPGAGSGSARRRGSGSGSYFGSTGSQLMESPTLTMSSRDTPRSASTAPTSVSGASWGRDGDREEIRELRDKHTVETGALLSALSDSQRTTKVLREENTELRERLARLEAEAERTVALERENQALREFVTELREEAGQLKLQLRLAAPVASSSSRYLTTTQPFRLSGRGRDEEDVSEDSYNAAAAPRFASSTPASAKNQRRRLSTSSSIFPAPPSNMSMLLHEDGANSSDVEEHSGASPTMMLPRAPASPGRGQQHQANRSIASVGSMATTSGNASILGSPRSLLLRPEHEVHLGDMDSLDLGRGGGDGDGDEEEWSE